jgi:hypothetical protein
MHFRWSCIGADKSASVRVSKTTPTARGRVPFVPGAAGD